LLRSDRTEDGDLGIAPSDIVRIVDPAERAKLARVQVTHLPSGIAVLCDLYPTQIKNKVGALAELVRQLLQDAPDRLPTDDQRLARVPDPRRFLERSISSLSQAGFRFVTINRLRRKLIKQGHPRRTERMEVD
jgi:hypothetical protein